MNAGRERNSSAPGDEGTFARGRDFSRAEAARSVLDVLASWRVRIAETQTLLRLALSFLQGPPAGEPGALSVDERAERCARLARLTEVEARALSRLDPPDLGLLRGSSGVRESGIDLRSFDPFAAAQHLDRLRSRAVQSLELVATTVDPERAPHAASSAGAARKVTAPVVRAFEHLEVLLRRVELLETTLSGRAEAPSVTVQSAVERASAAHNVRARCEGDGGLEVLQVRGLLRLLAELLVDTNAGGPVRVRARRAGSLLVMVLEGDDADHGGNGDGNGNGNGDDGKRRAHEAAEALDRDLHEYLRLVAYVLHGRAERAGPRSWTLTLGG